VPATVRASYYGAATTEPAGVNVDTVGGSAIKFNREDTLAGPTPVPIPTATGTNFSAVKQVALEVTVAGGGTAISNRRVHAASAPATGLGLHFLGSATYLNQQTTVSIPTASGSNGATPSTYTAMTTTAQVYAATSVTANTGRNGDFCRLVLGVDFSYAGGANPAGTVPNIVLTYDEA
jgi:hypothetical protein